MKTLLIYEEIPESTKTYLLDLTDTQYAKLAKCHGHYVNLDMPDDAQEAHDWLIDFLSTQNPIDIVPGDPFHTMNIDRVVVCGFYL